MAEGMVTGLAIGLLVGFVLGIIIGGWLRRAPHIEQLIETVSELQQRLDEWQQKLATQQQVDRVQNDLFNAQQTLSQIDRSLQILINFTQNNFQPQVSQQLQDAANKLGQVQQALQDAQQTLTTVSILSVLKETTERIESNINQVTRILTGRKSGKAGENIVGELLNIVPQDWIERNISIGKGQVEFAIKISGGYLIPLDSKFVAPELAAQLENETSGKQQQQLLEEVKRKLRERAREISKYLTDSKVLGFGIAAVPDSVYDLCREAVKTVAQNHSIVIVPYSLLLPFVLSLYLMAQRLGISRLGETDQVIGTAIIALDQAKRELENMSKEITTVNNQKERALERIEKTLNSLYKLMQGEIPLPENQNI